VTTRDPLALLADQLDPPDGDYPDGWAPEPHQIPPAGDGWKWWLFLAGRGAGKTDAGAHYVDRYARHNPGHRIAVIAPTLADARETCVRGESGLQNANPAIRFNVNDGTLHWPNGARGRIFGAFTPEDPERLRGPQHHLVWGDELAAWRWLEEVWKQMDFGLRLGRRPHGIFTTTPKSKPRIRRLLGDALCVVTRATTDDNPHLRDHVRAGLYDEYGGTVFGRQELLGELIDDEEDTVVPWSWVERCREPVERPEGVALLPVELGVDVGGGGDESVIRERRGPVAGRVWRDRQRDTMRVVGKTVEAIRETGATRVKVDVIGIGWGVCDRLEELRREGVHRAEVVRVNVGEGSSNPERFPKLRDQVWWEIARGLSESRGWDLSAVDDAVAGQLTAPRFSLDSAGRVKVESKDETRASLGRSPDDADALILAYFSPPRRTWTVW
jgi:hypothetical protein